MRILVLTTALLAVIIAVLMLVGNGTAFIPVKPHRGNAKNRQVKDSAVSDYTQRIEATPLPEGVVIYGWVASEEGRCIEGAKVSLRGSNAGARVDKWSSTDKSGRFVLNTEAVGACVLAIEAVDMWPQEYRIAGHGDVGSLVVYRKLPCFVTVQGPANEGVPPASVNAGRGGARLGGEALTDAWGGCLVKGRAGHRCQVVVRASGFSVARVAFADRDDNRLLVILEKVALIRGLALEEGRKELPVEGVAIHHAGRIIAKTDYGGNFEIEVDARIRSIVGWGVSLTLSNSGRCSHAAILTDVLRVTWSFCIADSV